MAALNLDTACLDRLALAERSVPRYTSYPTAPHFGAAVEAATYSGWLQAASPDATLSLYLHVPFCRQICAYCGCNTRAARRREPVDAYRERLHREIARTAAVCPARTVRHLHWGGGTPSTLGSDGMMALIEEVNLRFDCSDMLEHAIELDPRHVSPSLARTLATIGVTRASLGVQDLTPAVQQAIGRIQPFEVVQRGVGLVRSAGITSISMDLMYGLPHQREADLRHSIELVHRLAPDRIALFGYAHVPWFKVHQRLIDEAALPDTAARMVQAAAARELLLGLGYRTVGLDHFARPEDPLAQAASAGRLRRNFQGYTSDDADILLGFGASAIGRLPQGYVQNATDVRGYARAIDAGSFATSRGYALTPDDRLRAAAIERLMCYGRVDLDEVAAEEHCAAGLLDTGLAEIDRLARLGVVERDNRRIAVTDSGQPFLRLVAAAFDAHRAAAARHSRAV